MEKQYDTVIRISSAKAELVIEQERQGIVARKTLTPNTFARCVLGSRFDETVHASGFLPENCASVTLLGDSKIYCLRYPERWADISYYGTEYPHFPLPQLVFALKYHPESGKVIGVWLGVAAAEKLTPDSTMFVYPFSNVYGDDRVCLGNNALPIYKDATRLHTLPRLVLSFPNNNDMFRDSNNRLGLGYRELLEHLKDKPPDYYYSDVLIPNGKTLQDFISSRR